jgi:hypothetical protein
MPPAACRTQGSDIYVHHSNSVYRAPLNDALWNAAVGNWYMGALVLPTGKVAVMNMNMMQVRGLAGHGAAGGCWGCWALLGGVWLMSQQGGGHDHEHDAGAGAYGRCWGCWALLGLLVQLNHRQAADGFSLRRLTGMSLLPARLLAASLVAPARRWWTPTAARPWPRPQR